MIPFPSLVLSLWTLVKIGNLKKISLVGEDILIDRITTSWNTQIVWALQLLAIFKITHFKYQPYQSLSSEQITELQRWLTYAINHRLLTPFLLVLKGLLMVPEVDAKEMFLESKYMLDATDWIDDASILDQTSLSHNLLQETRFWLGELLFQDTIDSIDRLSVMVRESLNSSQDKR